MTTHAVLSLGLLLAAGAAPGAAQDRTFPQPGWIHAADKALYSWAGYAVLREIGVPRSVAGPVAAVVPWGVGMMIAERAGHRQPAVDKVHDLAAHSLVVLPLSLQKKPKVALGSLLLAVASIAFTCARANPRSC